MVSEGCGRGRHAGVIAQAQLGALVGRTPAKDAKVVVLVGGERDGLDDGGGEGGEQDEHKGDKVQDSQGRGGAQHGGRGACFAAGSEGVRRGMRSGGEVSGSARWQRQVCSCRDHLRRAAWRDIVGVQRSKLGKGRPANPRGELERVKGVAAD
ncbi:hypothetical protein FH972_024115 [Carpinus fangiana]|uniref:Uncharacterized protein n=1 Tax=Carpinus fangiana TaxID=176857 RepID=A0A5N6KXI2_9ROSI|nr:hypothetical protein FH972_024115 [Carpinus fangiana]